MTRTRFSRWGEFVLLALILILALGTRWGHAHKGLPYLHHVDEPHTSATALDIMKSGDLHPQRFQYGSVNVYMMLATDCLHYLYLRGHPDAPLGTVASLDSIEPATIRGYRWETSHPSFFLWNRGLCVLLGTLAVLLVYLIGRRESAIMGLVAAATLAAAPEHILNSAMVAPDIPVASFSLLAVALSVAYMRSAKTLTLVLAFVLAGVTVATKYNAAPVVIAPFLALAMGPRDGQARPSWLWWAGPLICGATFLACMPYILVDLPLFLTHVGRQVAHYSVNGHGPNTIVGGVPHMAWAVEQFASSFSWPGFVLACVGIVWSIRADRRRVVLFAFPLIYFAMQTQMVVAFPRNLLLLYPYLALGLGFALDRGWRWAGSRTPLWRRSAVALVVVPIAILHVREVRLASVVANSPETRTVAARELGRLARERGWKRIGISSRLRIHPLDRGGIEAELVIEDMPTLRAMADSLDAILSPMAYADSESGKLSSVLAVENLRDSIPTVDPLWRIEGVPIHVARIPINPGAQIFTPPYGPNHSRKKAKRPTKARKARAKSGQAEKR